MCGIKNFSITIFLSLAFTIGLKAQTLTQQGSKYILDGKAYAFEELGPILNDNPLASDDYTSALRKKRTAKNNGIISLSTLGAGLIALGIDPDHEGPCTTGLFCTSTGQDIFIVGVIASATFGTIGIIKKIGEKAKRKNAIKYYNEGLPLGYQDPAPVKEIYLGQTQNGLGMILNF